MFADDSGSFTCLYIGSGPSFKAQGLWRGEEGLICERISEKEKRSNVAETYSVRKCRVCSIVRKRGSALSVRMGLEDTKL